MKKINKNNSAPEHLSQYVKENPNNKWTQFTGNHRDGAEEVQACLRKDQRGLCAYCENDLKDFGGIGLPDFRVDHFFPKSPHVPPPNRSLDWQNLRAVCTGGNSQFIGDPERFQSHPDHSCDVPKGQRNLVGLILDPLTDIDPFEEVFLFDEDGHMFVSPNCELGKKVRAERTIKELRLSPEPDKEVPNPRLVKFRKKVIDVLRAELMKRTDQDVQGTTQAMTELAEIFFPSDSEKDWPAFFSTIRWFLGPAAEQRLRQINYMG